MVVLCEQTGKQEKNRKKEKLDPSTHGKLVYEKGGILNH